MPFPAATVTSVAGYCVVHAVGKKLLDELALITARLFDVPICLVLLDAAYDWQDAVSAAEPAYLPRPASLCAAAIAQRELIRLEAAHRHPSALIDAGVAEQLGLQRHVVQPLVTRLHITIGALCLAAATPRPPEAAQLLVLRQLAAAAALLIDLRASAAEGQELSVFWQQVAQELTPVLRQLLIAANQLRAAATATEHAAAWRAVLQLLEAFQQRLS
ncbi:hypothetical protein LJ737_21045 [Hymenobacter sp. 15J16-1T3B]|uniref:hypothetical protein n=1 Tax=Hymenobacter sp. 15J16-1T3B TaxID=2886941 RepID=UPI001D118FB3|nr:hypothetical protein [Hymenobacter sp. 15J16-1T3B]MCC3159742.1 hypothetical protein [Hymenobacter sp. 15J16-1T3B]